MKNIIIRIIKEFKMKIINIMRQKYYQILSKIITMIQIIK